MAFLIAQAPRRIARPLIARPASAGLAARLLDLLSLARQRRDLARLDHAALQDLGLSQTDAAIESARPVWDAPQHWMR